MEMCSLTALEPGSLKSRCRQGSALSEGLQSRVLPCLLAPGGPTVLGGPWLRDRSLQSLPPSAPGLLLWVSLFFSVSYKEMLRGFRGYPNPTSLYLQRLYFQIRSFSQVQRLGLHHVFFEGGHNSTAHSVLGSRKSCCLIDRYTQVSLANSPLHIYHISILVWIMSLSQDSPRII